MSLRARPKAQHFRTLEPCSIDHAKQYLIIQERKNTFELYVVHHLKTGSGTKRKYAKLAGFKKSLLDYHALANKGSKPLADNAEILREIRVKLSSVIMNLESANKKQLEAPMNEGSS